jgi:hypothetical protein
MGSNAVKDALLAAGFVNQADPALRQVPDSTMKQTAGTAAGAEGQVKLFRQSDIKASKGRIPRHSRSHNATANDQHVKLVRLEPVGLLRSKALDFGLTHSVYLGAGFAAKGLTI